MVAHENQLGVADDGAIALPALEEAGVVIAEGDEGSVTTSEATALADVAAVAAVEGDPLRIRLKLLDERVVEIEAPLAMSVADFRVKVAHATQVPVYRQRLIYRGLTNVS